MRDSNHVETEYLDDVSHGGSKLFWIILFSFFIFACTLLSYYVPSSQGSKATTQALLTKNIQRKSVVAQANHAITANAQAPMITNLLETHGSRLHDNLSHNITASVIDMNFEKISKDLSQRISYFDEIKSAWVHITKTTGNLLGKHDVLSASVMLALEPDHEITRETVYAILELMHSSIPDLNKNRISIVDNHGNILSDLSKLSSIMSTKRYFDFKKSLEESYTRKVSSFLRAYSTDSQYVVHVTLDIEYPNVLKHPGISQLSNLSFNDAVSSDFIRDFSLSDFDQVLFKSVNDPLSEILPIAKLKRIHATVIHKRPEMINTDLKFDSVNDKIESEKLKQALGNVIGIDYKRGDKLTIIDKKVENTASIQKIRTQVVHHKHKLIFSLMNYILASIGISLLIFLSWFVIKSKKMPYRFRGKDERLMNEKQCQNLLDFLNEYSDELIANKLSLEHPQGIASMLLAISEEKSAVLLRLLPKVIQQDVIRRMSEIDEVKAEPLSQFASVLHTSLQSELWASKSFRPNEDMVNNVLNRLDPVLAKDLRYPVKGDRVTIEKSNNPSKRVS